MIVTIDGPAGAGKGTIARLVARHYSMQYLDTGAVYRATALLVLMNDRDPGHEDDALWAAQNLDFDFRPVGAGNFHAFVGGIDVETRLRNQDVGQGASKVAFFGKVRTVLKDFQTGFVAKHKQGGVVLDGRDTGTVIAPHAEVKLFLDADPRVRAQRRMEELVAAGKTASFDEVHLQILERDARDRGRTDAPLKPADDAHIIDTSHLTIDEVFALAKGHIDKALKKAS